MVDFDSLQDDSAQQAKASAPAQDQGAQPSFDSLQDDSEKYGSPGQQIAAGLEGIAKGVAGPLAPAAELATGITTPEAIRGRAEANPWTHGLGEAAGFAGSALIPGLGEANLAAQIFHGLIAVYLFLIGRERWH